MEKMMSKRGKIRLASFLIFVICVLSVFAISGNVRAKKSEQQMELVSERALSDLDAYVSNMQVSLQKGIYANTTPMLSTLATNLWRDATGAKTTLGILPIPGSELSNTYKFLSQVGDFVMALQKKKERGEGITTKEREQLLQLLDFSDALSKEISEMRRKFYSGELTLAANDEALEANMEDAATLSKSLEDTEQSFTEYPSLIYDGPFSDHMSNRESNLLKNAEPISKDEAQKRAAQILNVEPQTLKFTSDEEDASQSYRFNDGTTSIAITKNGGYLLYMLSSKFVGEETLSTEEALAAAQDFLKQNGFENMKESYYAVSDGICTYNFAHTENSYTCYPDLIKVSVSLHDGSILSADCRGYILNHHDRTLKTPKIPEAQARKNLSPLLTPLDVKLAVIPTKSGKEKQAYEFHCKNAKEQELLVYIDTETGFEDDILLLLYGDGGTLTK